MQTPKFWYPQKHNHKHFWAYMLMPLGKLFYGLSQLRFLGKKGYVGKTPIICIGNVTAGGTGKTPTAIMLAQQAGAMGLKPAFLTKGYGGTLAGPYRVQNHDKVQDTGDEALILHSHGPCFISKDRVKGAEYIDSLGEFDLIITDDGLQNHPSIYQNAAILTIDAGRLFGNGCLIPAGPLREPVQQALSKASIIMIIGAYQQDTLPKILRESGKPIIHAHKNPITHGSDLSGEDVIVFSGLGNNDQFMNMIRQAGANIIHAEEFPDHFQYNHRIIERLIKQAQQSAALLVTTEKDMVKIPAHYYPYIIPFMITLDICEEDQKVICSMIQHSTRLK